MVEFQEHSGATILYGVSLSWATQRAGVAGAGVQSLRRLLSFAGYPCQPRI